MTNFSDLELIAGKNGLDRVIKAADVMDAPDVYEWLIGGEVVITTAYVMKDKPLEMTKLIKRLDKAGAAALCIKLKRFIFKMPQEAIDIANELQFPIIKMPYHYLFSEIINPLLSEVINDQAKRLSFSEKIHKSFTHLVISGVETQQIIDTIKSLINREVAFIDRYFEKTYLSSTDSEFTDIINNNNVEKILSKFNNLELSINNKIYGHLIYSEKNNIDGNNNFIEYDEIVLGHAITVLKLDIQNKISNHQIESKYREQFVQDLIFNNIQSLEEIKTRADLYNWEFRSSSVVIIFDIDDFKQHYVELESDFEDDIEEIKRTIFSLIERNMKDSFEQAVYTTFSDNMVFIIQNKTKLKKVLFIKSIQSTVEKIRNIVKERSKFDLTIGIGKYKKNTMNICKSYDEARKAVDLSRMMKKNKVMMYDNLGVYKLLDDLSTDLSAKKFYNSYLEELINYDDKNNTELVNTLEALSRNDWNMKEAAEEIYIHYNTMKYRVKRIEEIMDIDLQDPDEKFNLTFSLKLFNLNK
ncbi:MAG: PucR family transcriptional regulator [Bacillota bacterium]